MFIWRCGSRWAVVAATRYHQPGCVIGISTLALRSCAVLPTLACLVRVSICVVPMQYPLVASRSGGITVLYRLLALLRVKGYMGNPLTLFKSKFVLLFDIIMIAKYYYIVNSLTDP